MTLWHYQFLQYIPNLDLYYLQIFCQAVINQTILLTSDFKRENGQKNNQYYAVSDVLAYRTLVLDQMKTRKLPVWQLQFPWPYQSLRYHQTKRINGKWKHFEYPNGKMVRSNPICYNNFYLSPQRSKPLMRFSKNNLSPDNKYPNLLLGLFTQKSYLYQYAQLLERITLINKNQLSFDDAETDNTIKILNNYRKALMNNDNKKIPNTSLPKELDKGIIASLLKKLDKDIIKVLEAVKFRYNTVCIANDDGVIVF